MSEVAKMLNKIGQNRMQAEVFASFCRLTACAVAFQTRITRLPPPRLMMSSIFW
jgi:hypothetical protein